MNINDPRLVTKEQRIDNLIKEREDLLFARNVLLAVLVGEVPENLDKEKLTKTIDSVLHSVGRVEKDLAEFDISLNEFANYVLDGEHNA